MQYPDTKQGFVHIYYGNGKGKTTCGMGLCLRAAGAGMRVLIYQFMKDGLANERKAFERFPNVSFANKRRSVRFSFQMDETERMQEKERYRRDFSELTRPAGLYNMDVLFLDEILYAISAGLFEERDLICFLDRKPEHLEVILTGREASDDLKKRADYVSLISKEKHPYDFGVKAREGIER